MAAKDKMQGRRRTPFEVLMMVIATLIGSLLFSILLEWVGMMFFWSDQGLGHSRDMILSEISYLHEDLTNSTVYGFTPKEAVDLVFNLVFNQPFDAQLLEYERQLFQPRPWEQSPMGATSSGNLNYQDAFSTWGGYFAEWGQYLTFILREYLVAAIYISMVSLARIVIIVLSLPLFAVFMVVAIVDGLAQRDLRRFGGARESGTRYHFSKSAILPILLFGWLIYISFPVSINPNFVLLPMAFMFSMSIYLAIMNYKKYF